MNKDPYQIVKRRHITEKARVLQELKNSESNACSRACKSPKYVFIVDKGANKKEIAEAVEEIYSDKNVKVTGVNTINVKSKKRRVRGKSGNKSSFKKAIVTFEEGDQLDEI